MSSAASPTVRGEVTADDASVLCMLCTGTATGARLVATINLRMCSTLADARSILKSLAHGGDGGAAAVNDDPTNVTGAQAEVILNAPLHPFDFSGPFCFVHGGGNRAYGVERERELVVRHVLPRYPRLGVPPAAEWALSPPAPTAIVSFVPPLTGKAKAKGRRRGSGSSKATPGRGGNGSGEDRAAAAAAAFSATQKRLALCVLFVAQGSGQEGIQLERILAERLILQQTAPVPAASSSSSLIAATSATTTTTTMGFGRGAEWQRWCAAVTRWNANVPDLLGRTILQEMTAEGNELAVRYLAAQPFLRLHEGDRQGNTALHLAVMHNQSVCARALLDAGADPLRMNHEGNTALHLGLLGKKASLVGLLCSKLRATGIDAMTTLRELRNNEGLSPVDVFEDLSPTFMELCLDGTLPAVQSLLHHYLFDKTHLMERELGTQRTGLHVAAMNEVSRDVLPFLIAELGPTLFPAKRWRELLDNRLQTPLHIAAAHGCVSSAQALMAAYPRFLTHPDINGDTPLLVALKHRRVAVVEMLLTHSSPGAVAPNVCDLHGMTPLHVACGLGLRHVAEALLTQHGANAAANAAVLVMAAGSIFHKSSSSAALGENAVGPNDGGEGRMWESATGDRNVALVSSSVPPGVLAAALRMQKATGGRRRERAPRRLTAPHTVSSLSPSLLSPSFGGGMRGPTPLLCALIHANQQCQRGADMEKALGLVELIIRHGGLASAEDVRDALVFLLTHDYVGLADRILHADRNNSGGNEADLAAILREVKSDNKLLCRLCERGSDSKNGGVQARSVEPIRWCLDRRCCVGVNECEGGGCGVADAEQHGGGTVGYIRDAGLPLMTCARVGNVAATRFLLEVAGADPNVAVVLPSDAAGAATPTRGVPPLLVAIHGGHAEVAGLLVRAGARVSAGDGAWSALAAAAVKGLEDVVRGLLGLEALSPFDVPHALLEVLLADVNAAADGSPTEANYTGNAAPGKTAAPRRDMRAASRAARRRMCECLATRMDPTASTLVHPVELLHLSASRGFFSVTRIIADRLLSLPPSTMKEVLRSAPAAPTERPMELIESTMVPVEKCPWRRLMPNPTTGKVGLHRKPSPFMRLVLPSYRGARLQRQLPHRVVQRDVFSYAAAAVAGSSIAHRSHASSSAASFAADVVELVQTLRYDLGLRPWTVVDMRGCTPADYAMLAGHRDLMCFFAASGIAPHRRHDPREAGIAAPRGAKEGTASQRQPQQQWCGARTLATAERQRRRPRRTCPLARAIYASQQHHGDAAALNTAALCSLVAESTDKETTFAANQSIRALIEEQCRQHHAPDLRQAGDWMDPVLHACAAANRLDVLTMLTADYHLTLRRPSTPAAGAAPTGGTIAAALLVAVADENVPLLSLLLHAGCDAHEAALPPRNVVRYIKVRRAEDKRITPLCLAAWMGRYEAIRLLTSAAPFAENYFDDMQKANDADGGQTLCDALFALVRATPRGIPMPQEALLASAIRTLADAAHPFLSPLILREAAAKQLVHSVEAIVECYGARTFLADISDANSLRQVNSLHHFAAHGSLCGVLRSMLIMTETDEYGVASRKPTEVARALVSLSSSSSDADSAVARTDDTQEKRETGDDESASRPPSPVDWALMHNCAEGAVLLMAVGLAGTGLTQCLGRPTALAAQVQSTLRHYQRTRDHFAAGTFTVLHSAVALGLDAVVSALTAEMKTLAPVSGVVVLGRGMRATSTATAVDADGKRPAPSLHALAARDAASWRRLLPRLEDVVCGDVALAASDMFVVIFAGLGVTRALDAALRLACNAKVFASTFTVQDPDFDCGFLAKQLCLPNQRSPQQPLPCLGARACQASLLVDGGRAMLTGFTPLTCAIAAGSLEWVQYFTFVNPSAIAYHRATATELRGARARAREAFGLAASGRRPTGVQKPKKRHPSHIRHHCPINTQHGLSVCLTGKSASMDALVLSAALLADAIASRDVARITQHTQIFDLLVRVPGAVRRENVNAVAMAAAALERWPMLDAVLDQAMHMREMPAAERFLFTLLPEEVPLVLRRLLGPARHVMHVAARGAPQEVLLRIARHSVRADIEGGCDGNGRTSLFHALHHRHNPSLTLETFGALRIPMGTACCRRTARTPLMVAASEGRAALVSRLLKAERVNQQDRHGHTPLMLAAAHGSLPVVELLLAANADTKLKNRAGLTAVMLAARNGHDHVAAPMAQHFSHVKDYANEQTSLLHCAAVGGCWRTAEMVCRAAGDSGGGGGGVMALMREDAEGHTALYLAHCFGHAQTLRTIIAAFYESQRAAASPLSARARRGGEDDVKGGVDAHTRMLLASNATDVPSSPSSTVPFASGGRAPSASAALGEREKRVLRCDSSLPCYGWLRGVLQMNEVLVRQAQKSVATPRTECGAAWGAEVPLRPGERAIAPQLPSFRASTTPREAFPLSSSPLPRPARVHEAFDGTLLRWCAVVNNAVGIRVLADMNIADDCGALQVAARFGHMDTVKLLVSLDMSDPNVADGETGLFPFEAAALAGHTTCASYLLKHTRPDTVAGAAILSVPVPPLAGTHRTIEEKERSEDSGQDKRDTEEEATRYPHGVLHRLAPVCGGLLLVQAVEHMLTASNRVAALCETLWTLLQRPDETGFTPFEYTIAMGDPAAVLRCAQLLQQLAEEAAKDGGGVGIESVTIASSLLYYLPNLSPAVRAVLFDVFSIDEVSRAVGFDRDAAETATIAERQRTLKEKRQDSTTTAAIINGASGDDGINNGSAAPASPLSTGRGDGDGGEARPPHRTHRLSFADVRLLGINALARDEYCQSLVNAIYTIDHERLALRFLMKGFPYRIRYEPEAFGSRSLAQQKQLLQWLSTSLMLSSYDGAKPGDIETIEVKIAPHRGEALQSVHGAESGALSHSVYVSSSHYLVCPDVHAALKSTRDAYRSEAKRDLERRCRRATRAMRALPHPALRDGTVALDWNMCDVGAPSAEGQDVHADRAGWDSVVRRVRTSLDQMAAYFTDRVAELLRDVKEEDLAAVVSEVKRPRPATVCLRFVALPSEDDDGGAAMRFPPLSQLRSAGATSDDLMSCLLCFNRQTMTDTLYGLDHTIWQAVAGDVALVRVHYVRDQFLRRLRAALKRPMAREAAAAAERQLQLSVGDSIKREANGAADASGHAHGEGEGSQGDRSLVVAGSPDGQTFLLPALASVKFKLELESSTLAAIPVSAMSAMLEATADVVERLLMRHSPSRPSPLPSAPPADDVRRFHSADIIAEALGRKLRTVLVLFSTKREPIVKFSGDKLMLCFTPHLAPCAADVANEIESSIVAEETKVCRRLLSSIVSTLAQRLQSYLPTARLVVDLAAIDHPQADRASVLSSLRLLTYKHSALVLEPFVEGVCVGWEGPVGACVRHGIRQLTLTLETGERGTCYVTAAGNCVYYCPLQCGQRGGRDVKGPLATLSAWQLLTSQQVASLVILQLAVAQPELAALVDSRRAAACWTSVRRDGSRALVAGGHGYAFIQLRSMLNRVIRKPEPEEHFKFVSDVSKVRVRDLGRGRYRVKFTAPSRAGYTSLHVFLHGQQLLHSPLQLRVRPASVSLSRTTTVSTFDAVVAARLFDVELRLFDGFGNRLERGPPEFGVALKLGSDLDAEMLTWRLKGPDTVVVRLKAKRAKPEVLIHLLLTCSTSATTTDAGADPPMEHTHTLVYQCVDARTHDRVVALRRGVAIDALDRKATEHAKLFFRKSIRDAEAARLSREVEAIGAAAHCVFAPPVALGRGGGRETKRTRQGTTDGAAHVSTHRQPRAANGLPAEW